MTRNDKKKNKESKIVKNIYKLFILTFLIFNILDAGIIYVNSSTGSDGGAGTLASPYKTFYKAYTVAVSNDVIDLTGTFTWTDTDEIGDAINTGYTISKNLTINGQTAATTIIQAASSDNIADRRVFTVSTAYTVTFQNLTIRYGKTSYDAGGVLVNGTVIMDKVNLSYNRSTNGSGGGAQVEDGLLTIQNSTVNNNVATAQGGGLHTDYYTNGTGKIDIINTTIAFNSMTSTVATIGGGGVAYRGSGGTITNSTIAFNNIASGTANGAGIWLNPRLTTTMSIKNSIISGNLRGNSALPNSDYYYDVYKYGSIITLTDNGYNIIGYNNSSYSGFSLASTSWVDGTSTLDGTFTRSSGGSGSLYLSSTLEDNSTLFYNQTLSIVVNSIAIDNGNESANGAISIPTTDQRGMIRVGTSDIGAYEYGSTVPVELKSFTANTRNGNVYLNWATATESNNAGFEIERSIKIGRVGGDAQNNNWNKIGFIRGSGTSNVEKNYSFKDATVNKGKYSYRLKQIDRDGKFQYQNEASVIIGIEPNKIVLDGNYPNPFNPNTIISYQIPVKGNVTLKIFDILGKEVATIVNEIKEEGFHQVNFNASSLVSGVYYSKLQSNGQSEIKKMVLMK